MDEARRCLSFEKGNHRFVFWYTPGCESELLAAFLEYAEREDVDFDWFDAAVLSYQMGKVVTTDEGRRAGSGRPER